MGLKLYEGGMCRNDGVDNDGWKDEWSNRFPNPRPVRIDISVHNSQLSYLHAHIHTPGKITVDNNNNNNSPLSILSSYAGRYHDPVSARFANVTGPVLNLNLKLKRWSRPLNLTQLHHLAHLVSRISRVPSSFVDLITSELEGVVDETIMAIPEESILEAKDPNITDTDKWPSFSLRKVNIVSMRNGQTMSLLEAHQDNPVKVSGQLETISKDELHLGIWSIPLPPWPSWLDYAS